MFVNPLPPADDLRRLFAYDERTGVLTRANGKAAGTNNGRYPAVQIAGKKYLVHRVIWKMVTGQEPAFIDHKDLNKLNNAWGNLRNATKSDNEGNAPVRRDSLSGCKGIRRQGGRFHVRVYRNGSWWCASYDSLQAAQAAHLEKSIEFFGEFARSA